MKKLLAILLLAASLPCLAQPDSEVKYIVVKGNMAGCPSPDVLVIEAAWVRPGEPAVLFGQSLDIEWPPAPNQIVSKLRKAVRSMEGHRPGILWVEVLEDEPLYRNALKELYRNLQFKLDDNCTPQGLYQLRNYLRMQNTETRRTNIPPTGDFPDVPLWQLEEDLEKLIRELRYRNVIGPVPEDQSVITRDSRPDA